ncbi:MAG TPA: site-specific integrase [bacterium]|nr:site-specific integrase [bacterium]
MALLSAILESAAVDYELIPVNPLRGILRRRNFPTDALRSRDRRPALLEPDDFRRAVEVIADPRPRWMVLLAVFTGLRWGGLVAIRMEDEVDFQRNHLRVTRAFYRRTPQTPKREQSVRDVDMLPLVRAILKTVPWSEGLAFSPDGTTRIGEGPWIKRQWRQAQLAVRIRQPIKWHHLRHQFVSLLIAAGKNPLYIAEQAGHSDPGFTLKRYGHLFKTIKPTPVEWPEDLLWPAGSVDAIRRADAAVGREDLA